MGKRSLSPSAGWRPSRRFVLAAGALITLLLVAGAVAWWTGSSKTVDAAPQPHATASPTAGATDAAPSPAGESAAPVAGPPPVSDPLAFARAAATMLWSFDARTTSHTEQLAGMKSWMTSESAYADWDSVQAQIPDPVLWLRLKDNGQHATAAVSEAHFPSAFKQAIADDPAAITEAYIYAVTVRGKTQLAWTGGGSGAEDRQITLAVQCRPSADCRLVAVAPRVAP
ncbi:hypothetical protein [Streptomyces sp. NRRL F-5193]|uniref:hypothetical protein n=1 Tax=Streptomyces sp. NRRL F-5193 TaxID=1463860 RepID=UPI0005BBA193|nr:hypothetical protein [Streptomyces sp. NRRL F-5193]